jgi:hypothetical protein
MDENDIENIVQNMIENYYRGDAVIEIENMDNFSGNIADKKATAKILGVPSDVHISNNRWHEGHGYEMDFLSSQPGKEYDPYDEVNYRKVKVVGDERIILEIVIPK